MKISRFLKTVFMIDFLTGLIIATKEIFKPKKTINYPHEKGSVSPRSRGEHALRRYPNVKKDVLLVNCAKLYAQHKLLPLNQQREKMEVEKQLDTILICLNVFIVVYAKSLAPLMLLFKDQTLNFQLKLGKNSTITKKNY